MINEQRKLGQKTRRQSVHRLGFGRHVACRIDVTMKFPTRRNTVEKFDATDLDQAVAFGRIKTGGFRIQNDFAHCYPL